MKITSGMKSAGIAVPQLVIAAALALGASHAALAKSPVFNVLYTFTGGNDGQAPEGTLLADKAGNFYGATAAGGADGKGVIFKLAPNGSESILYTFTGGNDGGQPATTLIADKAGNLYGTALSGGANGAGVVFKLAPDGTETVLYAFTGKYDGQGPVGGLAMGKKGYIYGATGYGGQYHTGVLFKLSPDGKETVLHSFGNGNDAAYPMSGPIIDAAGNLYGTTNSGGTGNSGGAVYEFAKDGTESVLYSFTGGHDGGVPNPSPVMDSAGNLYGTTVQGGSYHYGVAYKVRPDGTETVLHSFNFAGGDGYYPEASLMLDKAGNLYGTTVWGGSGNGDGTVFKLTPDGKEKILYSFQGTTDGSHPWAGLIKDNAAGSHGTLYGVAAGGGANGYGTIFSITK